MQKLRAKNFLTLTQKFQKSLQLILGIWVKHRMNEQFCRWQMEWLGTASPGATDSSEAKGAREHATFSIQHWWLTKLKGATCRITHIQRTFCKVKLEVGVRGEKILFLALLGMLILLPKALKRFSITLGIKFIVPAFSGPDSHSPKCTISKDLHSSPSLWPPCAPRHPNSSCDFPPYLLSQMTPLSPVGSSPIILSQTAVLHSVS